MLDSPLSARLGVEGSAPNHFPLSLPCVLRRSPPRSPAFARSATPFALASAASRLLGLPPVSAENRSRMLPPKSPGWIDSATTLSRALRRSHSSRSGGTGSSGAALGGATMAASDRAATLGAAGARCGRGAEAVGARPGGAGAGPRVASADWLSRLKAGAPGPDEALAPSSALRRSFSRCSLALTHGSGGSGSAFCAAGGGRAGACSCLANHAALASASALEG
mmetsp:Transcript_11697/g.38539  ORF Transcript_11697/g.38539 Transcript_11697/m.38539 type:complete len:223 (+) Transcript_11697:353-1021(+)|eukprot:scaffold5082_cov106-Isochrysis_galbana.AAC.2